MSDERFNSASWKMLGWLLDIIAISALAFSVHLHTRISSIELWVAESRGSRYTAADRVIDAAKDASDKQAIWKAMNDMQSQWLKDIGEINVTMAEIRAEVKASRAQTSRP